MYNNTCISIIIQFLQGNLFLLAVCTHEVPPYLCSIFCSHSLMQVSIANYHVWSAEHACKLYPVTLVEVLQICDK